MEKTFHEVYEEEIRPLWKKYEELMEAGEREEAFKIVMKIREIERPFLEIKPKKKIKELKEVV